MSTNALRKALSDMNDATTEYRALIGGLLYRNVSKPIVFNDKSLISFTRSNTTGQLAVTLDTDLVENDGSVIASLRENVITLNNTTDFVKLLGLNRQAVMHKQTGRIWCDLRLTPDNYVYELALSCILLIAPTYPIVLHPDRTKFGTINDNAPPNWLGGIFESKTKGEAGAFRIENSAMYVLNAAFENLGVGIDISVQICETPSDGD